MATSKQRPRRADQIKELTDHENEHVRIVAEAVLKHCYGGQD